MASTMPKDFTMRIDRTGAMALSTKTEHVLGLIQQLMFKTKGRDDMNQKAGLTLRSKMRATLKVNERDSDYEQEITDQLMTYTDLIPTSVVAINDNGTYRVYLTVSWSGDTYQIITGEDMGNLDIETITKPLN